MNSSNSKPTKTISSSIDSNNKSTDRNSIMKNNNFVNSAKIKDIKESISKKIVLEKSKTEVDSKDKIKDRCLSAYFETQEELGFELRAKDMTAIILFFLNREIAEFNSNKPKGMKNMGTYDFLPPDIIAEIIKTYEPIGNIALNKECLTEEDMILGIYCPEGRHEGTYKIDEPSINRAISKYSSLENSKQVAEVRKQLVDKLNEPIFPDSQPNKVAVLNGIFDWETKELEPFSPEYVTLNKMNVFYDPDMEEPEIIMPDGEVWTPTGWLDSLTDDEEVRKLLLDIITASIFSSYKWDKTILLYSPKGNNGKGTFLNLLQNMQGAENWTEIALQDYARDEFMLSALGKKLIISHESDVGAFIASARALKCFTTQDAITVNRKFKTAIRFVPVAFGIHAINDIPRFKDKSASLQRRFLIVPFDKCFKGVERKYIREDYLKRKEVLSYFFKLAVENGMPDFDNPPQACLELMDEFKETNNPTYVFYKQEMCEYGAWSAYPIGFVYDHYKAWFAENYDSGKVISSKTFANELRQAIEEDENTRFKFVKEKTQKRIPKENMAKAEPAIVKYELEKYINKAYHGSDIEKMTNFDRNKFNKCYAWIECKQKKIVTEDDE